MGPHVHELTNKDFSSMFEMNFISTLNTCKAAIPIMLTQGSGKIINVSARAATEGKGKMAPLLYLQKRRSNPHRMSCC